MHAFIFPEIIFCLGVIFEMLYQILHGLSGDSSLLHEDFFPYLWEEFALLVETDFWIQGSCLQPWVSSASGFVPDALAGLCY